MSWIATRSGGKLDFLNPNPSQIHIEDIATALSRLPRFAGHTSEFYSVAQHSFHASCRCDKYPLEALLHDASEAYMGDCPRPLKELLGDSWVIIESRLSVAIGEKFNLRWHDSDAYLAVKEVDDRLLFTERNWLMPNSPPWEWQGPEPYDFTNVTAMQPGAAVRVFLTRYRELTL